MRCGEKPSPSPAIRSSPCTRPRRCRSAPIASSTTSGRRARRSGRAETRRRVLPAGRSSRRAPRGGAARRVGARVRHALGHAPPPPRAGVHPRRPAPAAGAAASDAGWHPAAVELHLPRLRTRRSTRIFGVPPRFEARDAALVVPGEVCAARRARDPSLFAVAPATTMPAAAGAPSAEDDLVERVRAAVATELTGRAPSLCLRRAAARHERAIAAAAARERADELRAGGGSRSGASAPRRRSTPRTWRSARRAGSSASPTRARSRARSALDGAVTRAVAPRARRGTG